MVKSLTDIATEIYKDNFLPHRERMFGGDFKDGYLVFTSAFQEGLLRAEQWQEELPSVAATLQRLQPNDLRGVNIAHEIMLLVVKLSIAGEGRLEGEAARVVAEKRVGDYLEEYVMTSQDAHDQVATLIGTLRGKQV